MNTVSVGAAFALMASDRFTVPPTVVPVAVAAPLAVPVDGAAATGGGIAAGAAFCGAAAIAGAGGMPPSLRASVMLAAIDCTIGESAGCDARSRSQ